MILDIVAPRSPQSSQFSVVLSLIQCKTLALRFARTCFPQSSVHNSHSHDPQDKTGATTSLGGKSRRTRSKSYIGGGGQGTLDKAKHQAARAQDAEKNRAAAERRWAERGRRKGRGCARPAGRRTRQRRRQARREPGRGRHLSGTNTSWVGGRKSNGAHAADAPETTRQTTCKRRCDPQDSGADGPRDRGTSGRRGGRAGTLGSESRSDLGENQQPDRPGNTQSGVLASRSGHGHRFSSTSELCEADSGRPPLRSSSPLLRHAFTVSSCPGFKRLVPHTSAVHA